MPVLRPAVPSDALAISLLAAFSFRETFRQDFHHPADLDAYCRETFAYDKIRKSMAKDTNCFLVLEVAGELVGYAKMKMAATPVQLQKIYLHPAFIGRGLGRTLLDECLRVAGASGAQSIWLAVEKRNARAIAFYLKNGFTRTGEFDFTIGRQIFRFARMDRKLGATPA